MKQLILILLSILTTSCEEETKNDTTADQNAVYADVTKVGTSGSGNNYSFAVTISSPDKGCEQYADWWEIVSESGELLYRRILLHGHVSEQPFTRSGGSVNIADDQTVWIRAHMNNSGYGGQSLRGSVKDGFDVDAFPENLGIGLDQVDPLPSGCNF